MNCGTPLGGHQRQQDTYYNGNNPYNSNPYHNQNPYQAPYPKASVKYRNIALCVIFSIISCGIYGIYWFIQLTEDSNELSGDYRTSGGVAFLLSLLTCGIYGIYWAYRLGQKIDDAKAQRGIPSSNSGVLYLILYLVGFSIITNCLAQNEINKFATE